MSINNELSSLKMSEITVDNFKDYFREATDYLHKRNLLFQRFAKEKTKSSEVNLHYPFIVDKDDILAIDAIVNKRINDLSNSEAHIEFTASATFKNGDTVEYIDLDSLFNSLVESKIVRVEMHWRYILLIPYESENDFFGNEDIPIPLDIVIVYSTRHERNEHQAGLLSEYQFCLVENLTYDWINETINQIKVAIKKTRMPFWYYWLKLLRAKTRSAISSFLYAFFMIFGISFFTNYLTTDIKSIYVNLFNNAESLEQKIDILIDYLMRPTDWSYLIYYALGVGVAFVLYLLALLFYEYITPPSMFLFGADEKKLRNMLAAYNYVWAGVVISGFIIPSIIAIFN